MICFTVPQIIILSFVFIFMIFILLIINDELKKQSKQADNEVKKDG